MPAQPEIAYEPDHLPPVAYCCRFGDELPDFWLSVPTFPEQEPENVSDVIGKWMRDMRTCSACIWRFPDYRNCEYERLLIYMAEHTALRLEFHHVRGLYEQELFEDYARIMKWQVKQENS